MKNVKYPEILNHEGREFSAIKDIIVFTSRIEACNTSNINNFSIISEHKQKQFS
jgi:hypothetical protein